MTDAERQAKRRARLVERERRWQKALLRIMQARQLAEAQAIAVEALKD